MRTYGSTMINQKYLDDDQEYSGNYQLPQQIRNEMLKGSKIEIPSQLRTISGLSPLKKPVEKIGDRELTSYCRKLEKTMQ